MSILTIFFFWFSRSFPNATAYVDFKQVEIDQAKETSAFAVTKTQSWSCALFAAREKLMAVT